MSLTPEQVQIIKATVPVVQEHGTTITTVFYENMLREHPELNTVFNTTNQVTGHQARALAGALYAYAANIDNLDALTSSIKLITHRHASLYIQPDDYKIVGEYLLAAMKQVLGDACTPDILNAWTAAYWQLANILINKEANLYRQSGDWTDWREFRIVKKVPESDDITSFYLAPVDGKKPLPTFRPGQYISVRVYVPGLKYPQPRQYSLSDMPRSDYYRISVKKEPALNPAAPGAETHPGYVSNVLHDLKNEGDVIEVSHPFGDFYLSDDDMRHPVVLLSAGVGLTPLLSILNTLTSRPSHPERKIHFIHGARRASARAFKDHVRSLADKHENLKVTFFASSPAQHEQRGIDFHRDGRVDLQKLDWKEDLFLDDPRTEFYICGPAPFMTKMFKYLEERGVDSSRIKMELFGAGGVLHGVQKGDLSLARDNVKLGQSVLIAALGAGLGFAIYRRHAEGKLSWSSSISLWSAAVGAIAVSLLSWPWRS